MQLLIGFTICLRKSEVVVLSYLFEKKKKKMFLGMSGNFSTVSALITLYRHQHSVLNIYGKPIELCSIHLPVSNWELTWELCVL